MGIVALSKEDIYPPTAAKRVRAELAIAENARRSRLAAEAQEHYERTRQSYIVEGEQLGLLKPTAQTEAKLKLSPITRLHDSGRITGDQAKAALEIAQIYEHLVCRILCRASSMAPRVDGKQSDRITTLDRLHTQHYLPWATHLGGRDSTLSTATLPGSPGVKGRCPVALEMAIDVLVDGMVLAEVERARRWRHGKAAEVLRYALMVYTDIAGWENNRSEVAVFESEFWKNRF